MAGHTTRKSPEQFEVKPKCFAENATTNPIGYPRYLGSRKPRNALTKKEMILKLLRRAKGATLAEMGKASGWQAHSVRGFLSGTVRKQMGLVLECEVDGKGSRRYRIVGEHQPPAEVADGNTGKANKSRSRVGNASDAGKAKTGETKSPKAGAKSSKTKKSQQTEYSTEPKAGVSPRGGTGVAL